MNANTLNRINGYGSILRFITPILITIAIFILGMVREDLGEVKQHFRNHLSEHKIIEITLDKRLSRIETILESMK